MKRFCTLFFLTFGLLLLLSIGISAETRTATFYNGETAVKTVTLDGEGSLTLATAPNMGTKKFIGWAVTRNGTETLHPEGSVFNDADGIGNLSFHAVGIGLKTLDGAAVTYASPTVLRFDGAVDLSDYSRLTALVGAENITTGVLIAPYSQVSITPLKLTTASVLNRVSDGFLYSTRTLRVFSGSTDTIPDDHLLEKYCGRAYLSVTFGGQTLTVYADYDIEKHIRSAHGVTAAAFEDRFSTSDATHTVPAACGCYSRYSADRLNALQARLDKVIYVSMAGTGKVESKYSMDNFDFKEFNTAHYTSPYRVERFLSDEPHGYDTYVITGVNGTDFNTVTAYFVGGSYFGVANRAAEWKSDGIYISVINSTP
ncbi:MAG: hypothetical protein IJX39_08500 [Clostridia bacterium]|nr:hypothetical protein [Clostridia bacterium]